MLEELRRPSSISRVPSREDGALFASLKRAEFWVRYIVFNSLKRTDLPEFCLGRGKCYTSEIDEETMDFKNEFFLNQAPASFTLIFVKEALQFVLFGFVAFFIGFFFPRFDCGFEGFGLDHCKVFSSFERDIL